MANFNNQSVDVSVIIVNWNTKDLLLDCLTSVFQTIKSITFEVWLVDNASTDGSVETAKSRFPGIKIIENNKNLGFAVANNRAFKRMRGRYALLLNTDTVLTDGAVEELYCFMDENPKTGLVCGQLLNQDGTKQNSIANFPSLVSFLFNETLLRILLPRRYPSKRKEYKSPIEVDSCIGACMMAHKEALDEIRFFNEDYFFFFEETDLAYRMKQAGWKVFHVPSARIFHAQGKSVGMGLNARIMFYRSRYIFLKTWRPHLYGLFCTLIFIRLLINTFFSLLGLVLTLGLHKPLKTRFIIYNQLIIWHLRWCPENG
jgi:GT2 family glycosyltransferase